MYNKKLLSGLTDEQIAKVKSTKSHEELYNLAKKEGVELSNEQLEVIRGGGICSAGYEVTCPDCDSLDVEDLGNGKYKCRLCKKEFKD